MIRYVTPYATDKNLAKAYNYEMSLARPGEFVCFLDRDVWMPHPHFGHHIERIVALHGTAFYTALTNRTNCPWQRSSMFHYDINTYPTDSGEGHCDYAKTIYNRYGSEVEVHTDSQLWSGHLMICPKDHWIDLPENFGLLGVDNQIHAMARVNSRVLLMKGVYVWHYYSGYSGPSGTGHKKRDKSHLI